MVATLRSTLESQSFAVPSIDADRIMLGSSTEQSTDHTRSVCSSNATTSALCCVSHTCSAPSKSLTASRGWMYVL